MLRSQTYKCAPEDFRDRRYLRLRVPARQPHPGVRSLCVCQRTKPGTFPPSVACPWAWLAHSLNGAGPGMGPAAKVSQLLSGRPSIHKDLLNNPPRWGRDPLTGRHKKWGGQPRDSHTHSPPIYLYPFKAGQKAKTGEQWACLVTLHLLGQSLFFKKKIVTTPPPGGSWLFRNQASTYVQMHCLSGHFPSS